MKRLLFSSFFFFGAFLFGQPQAVLANVCEDNGGSCYDNTASCPSGEVPTSDACDAGTDDFCCGSTSGVDTVGAGGTCTADAGFGNTSTGVCGTIAGCSGTTYNLSDCDTGLICCGGLTTGAPSGATPQSVCVGKRQDDPCVGPTFNEPGTCRAVPTASSPLSCVVNTGAPNTGDPADGFGRGSIFSGNGLGGATVGCNGVLRAGVCFPTGTGLSDTPVWFLLMRLMWWLLAVFGMIAIIAFVISGIQYLISAGNEAMIETAKRNMTYSLLGVLVGLSGWIIIRAIDAALSGWNFWYF